MNARAGLSIAEVNYTNSDWDELLDTAQKVIDLKPKTEELVSAVFYKGEALFQLGRYEDCEKTLQEVSSKKMTPEMMFKINSRIALAKAKLGQYDEGLKFLGSMQNKGRFSDFAPRIRLDIGMIYEMQGSDETAMDTYTKLAGDFPDSLAAKEAWYRIGRLRIKDFSKAKEAKDAFTMVMKGSAKTNALWYIDAQNKTV
jgi:tetratricopeptide (TPR) repeat protein